MEHFSLVGPCLKLIKFIWDPVINFFIKLINYSSRPKLKIDSKQQSIKFISQNNEEQCYNYLCLLINNFTKKKYLLNLKQVRINNESYSVLAQADRNFSNINPKSKNHWIECKNDVYKTYSKYWVDICENRYTLPLNELQTIIFPLELIKESSHCIIQYKKQSLLFFPRSKISLTLELNRKQYEYGINRRLFYEGLINYLAFLKS